MTSIRPMFSFFDVMQLCMGMEHAQRMLRVVIVAQHQIQLILAVPHPGNGGDGVMWLAVGLGKDEAFSSE